MAQVCREQSVRCLSVRAISDDVASDLPPEVLTLLGPTGTTRLGAALGAIFKRPESVRDMWKLRAIGPFRRRPPGDVSRWHRDPALQFAALDLRPSRPTTVGRLANKNVERSTCVPGSSPRSNYGYLREHPCEVAVLPMGATEPHNLHLPYGTDIFEAEAIAGRACEAAFNAGAARDHAARRPLRHRHESARLSRWRSTSTRRLSRR